jgi:hypothetical protein
MAEILGLGSPKSSSDVIKSEVECRVRCSLYVTELWCLSGQGLHSQMRDMSTRDVPMSDSAFLALQEDTQAETRHPYEPGIWSQLVTLVPLFAPIHTINQKAANGQIDGAELNSEVTRLAHQLEWWKSRLPAEARMTPSNLHKQQRLGLGGLLISLHMAYHHFSILLYFRFLEDNQTPKQIHKMYIARCKLHASSFSSLLLQSRQLKGCGVVYPNVAHMTTVSSAVLVHTLLSGQPAELDAARQELSTNFEALMEVTQHWPATSAMVSATLIVTAAGVSRLIRITVLRFVQIDRLVAFQNMCLLSRDAETHRLDGWMLEFLVNHSLERPTPRDEATDSSHDRGDILAKACALGLDGRLTHLQA